MTENLTKKEEKLLIKMLGELPFDEAFALAKKLELEVTVKTIKKGK